MLDLRNLTQKHFAEAEATKPGVCSYSAPCIIGTLMTEEQRIECDDAGFVPALDNTVVEIATGQREDMLDLQVAFDSREKYRERYERVKARIIKDYGLDV